MSEWEIAFIFSALGLVLGVLLGRIWAYSNIIAEAQADDGDS